MHGGLHPPSTIYPMTRGSARTHNIQTRWSHGEGDGKFIQNLRMRACSFHSHPPLSRVRRLLIPSLASTCAHVHFVRLLSLGVERDGDEAHVFIDHLMCYIYKLRSHRAPSMPGASARLGRARAARRERMTDSGKREQPGESA